ncbi:MAG: hypothetical protein RI996_300 [Candidatus Parcubacteria bacterium]|jgi:Fic family protein
MATYTKKQLEIITSIALKGFISSRDMKEYSRTTFSREIKTLLEKSFVEKKGSGPSTVYIKSKNFYSAPIDSVVYFQVEQDKRIIEETEDSIFFERLKKIFTDEEKKELDEYTKIWRDKIKTATPTTRKKEFERITTELSWKSSQIEGNTYSLLDTERLLKEGEQAHGHSDKEAIMILNHKETLEYIAKQSESFKILNRTSIEEIHRILVHQLDVETGLRRGGVGILGTNYRPKDNVYQIQDQIHLFFKTINEVDNIPTKAILALICVAYIQPFADGNKRTSRMLANACLLSSEYPILSFRSIDEVEYKKAILLVYEQHNIFNIKKLFIDQYRHACTQYFG